MRQDKERRAKVAQRIPLETLVEICSDGSVDRPFEAESVDLSGHGMRMRTAYLPSLGAPLACRFSDRGRAVVVEGVVAWRNEHARGGEFGVKFTALDASGADVLRELCGVGPTAPLAAAAGAAAEPLAAGTRVRLHLDGLGEPMKARVRDAGPHKVQVASNLAFLRLGRRMNVEDIDHSSRHGGNIESVGVVIEPQSGVPQLVVSLRFDEADDTPQPSVVDLEPRSDEAARSGAISCEVTGSGQRAAASLAACAASTRVHESNVAAASVEAATSGRATDTRGGNRSSAHTKWDGARPPSDLPLIEGSDRAKSWGAGDTPEAELVDAANRLRSRLGTQAAAISVRAEAAARHAQTLLSRYSASAARQTTDWLRDAARRAMQLRRHNQAKPRRRTAPPPRGALSSVEGRRLRPQAASAPPPRARAESASAAGSPARTRKLAIGIGMASVVVAAAIVVWVSGRGPTAAPAANNGPQSSIGLRGPAVAAGTSGPQQPGAAALPAAPPGAAAPSSTAVAVAKPPGAPTSRQGILAEVPLFGRTAMATMEPVPVPSADVPPGAVADEEAAERAAAEASANETWHQQEAEVRPEDVKPWGRGRLHLPTIHRVKLDRPGADLRGASQAKGFSVLIPKRRVSEAVAGLAKRDRRITSVKVDNSKAGARLTFRFRDKAPPFRVRLRGSYVEFLISAAE